MKKFFVLILSILTISSPVFADMVLQGAAEYNVQSAREEVTEDVQFKINPRLLSPYLIDQNHIENISTLLNGQVSVKDRELAMFSTGTYGVVYKNDPLHAYYYSKDGVLEYFDVRSGKEYPYKSYQYDTQGQLVNMGLRLSKRETYLYSPNGKLLAHWVGANGYDETGNIIMTRKYLE